MFSGKILSILISDSVIYSLVQSGLVSELLAQVMDRYYLLLLDIEVILLLIFI